MAGYEDLLYEVKGRVAVLTLNRPDKLNAWTAAMERSVKQAMAAAVADDNVRAIVVTGAGRGFCAGADMGLLQQIKPETWEDRELAAAAREEKFDFQSGLGPDVSPHYGGRFGYLMQVKKPVIAAINGPAAGLGLVFALYADIRFAGSEAKFTTAFASRGLIAEHGISWLLPQLVGPARALAAGSRRASLWSTRMVTISSLRAAPSLAWLSTWMIDNFRSFSLKASAIASEVSDLPTPPFSPATMMISGGETDAAGERFFDMKALLEM